MCEPSRKNIYAEVEKYMYEIGEWTLMKEVDQNTKQLNSEIAKLHPTIRSCLIDELGHMGLYPDDMNWIMQNLFDE